MLLKQFKSGLLAVLVVCLLGLAAQAQGIVITMGPMGGTMYPVGAVIADMIMENIPGTNANPVVGGSITNIELVNRGECQIGHTTTELVFAAVNGGIEPFEEARENINTLAKVMNQYVQIAVTADTGLTSVAEIKEKRYPLRICTNPRGNIAELTLRRILEANGITYDDIISWGGKINFVSHADAASLIKDGHADALALYTSMPAPAFQEIALSKPIRLLDIGEEAAKQLAEEFGYAVYTLPKDIYKGHDRDVISLGGGIILVINKNLPEDLVYNIAKIINSPEGQRRIGAIHVDIEKDFVPEKACQDLGGPLHPGAERFYREIGVLQ